MKEKCRNSLLIFSLLITTLCGNVKAMNDDAKPLVRHKRALSLPPSPSAELSPAFRVVMIKDEIHETRCSLLKDELKSEKEKNELQLQIEQTKINTLKKEYEFLSKTIVQKETKNTNLQRSLRVQKIYTCGLIIAVVIDSLLSHSSEPRKNIPCQSVKKAVTLNDQFHAYLTKIEKLRKNKYVTLLHQSIRDTKELEILSFLSAIPVDQRIKGINGYSATSSIPTNSIINFFGETTNALVLRYFRKPIANKCKPITDRLKRSKNTIAKIALKNPCLYLAHLVTIEGCWRLQKYAINRILS